MTTDSRIISVQIWLAREGAAYTLPNPGGTVGRESKPGADDPAAWVSIGFISGFDLGEKADRREVMVAVPGRVVRWDVIKTNQKIDVSWTCEQLPPLAIELITGSQPLTGASTQFNPGAGGQKRFWLKAQAYDHNDIPIKTVDLFGCLYADSLQFGTEVARCKMNFESIYSTKQSGVISA